MPVRGSTASPTAPWSRWLKPEAQVIITLDKDFDELHHRRERGQLGVIIRRLHDESIASVNEVLGRLFRPQASEIDLDRTLVVLDEMRARIRSES